MTAASWLILMAAQMIIPHSAKLICNASAIAKLTRILAVALFDVICSCWDPPALRAKC